MEVEMSVGSCSAYIRELYCPTLSAQGCRFLHSTDRGALIGPFARTFTKQIRAFSVVGSSGWNGLPLALCLLPRVHSDTSYSHLKHIHSHISLQPRWGRNHF